MPRKLIRNARALRVNQAEAEAEARLWSRLRNRSLDGFKFRRQIAVDPFVVDFLCSEAMLIVELDGGQSVMRGLDPRIHVFAKPKASKTWMADLL